MNEKPDKVMKNIYFDYSHPGARAYIAECIRNMKENWGIRYFKVDFMRYGLKNDIKAANKQVKSIKAHDPTITSVERFRLGMKTMREAMGPDTYFLGCSAVFGPCIGFVDGMRTGGDISPRYEAFPERSLANLGHFYLSGKVFNGDADYLVFRAAADEDEKVSKEEVKRGGSLTMNEAQMWADLNKLYGNCRLNSDNLMTLRPERQALVKEVFQYPAMDETVPLDVWRHATSKGDGFELVLARKGKEIYLGVFNWSDTPKEYALAAFGKPEPVKLAGRHSVILKYDGKDSFAQLCQKLQIPVNRALSQSNLGQAAKSALLLGAVAAGLLSALTSLAAPATNDLPAADYIVDHRHSPHAQLRPLPLDAVEWTTASGLTASASVRGDAGRIVAAARRSRRRGTCSTISASPPSPAPANTPAPPGRTSGCTSGSRPRRASGG